MRIELKNINYIYNYNTSFQKHVLKSINLTIDEDETIFILGKTGSGKTTLLYILDLLIKPTSGEVIINSENPFKDPYRFRKKIGFAFQLAERQFFSETVKDEIMYSMKNFGIENPEERLKEVQQIVGIEDNILGKSPFEISGGQQRKVAIASAIAHDPELLILDEPTVGLDYKAEKNLMNFLRNWHSLPKKSLVIVTHDFEKFKEFEGKVLRLVNGRLI